MNRSPFVPRRLRSISLYRESSAGICVNTSEINDLLSGSLPPDPPDYEPVTNETTIKNVNGHDLGLLTGRGLEMLSRTNALNPTLLSFYVPSGSPKN